MSAPRPADRMKKLVALAASADGTPEGEVARAKARAALAAMDAETLDTLAGQRKHLLKKLHAEHRRLWRSKSRATKRDTGELVGDAMLLLGHYERYDALISAIMLARLEAGRELDADERQQLDGPLPRWPFDWRDE